MLETKKQLVAGITVSITVLASLFVLIVWLPGEREGRGTVPNNALEKSTFEMDVVWPKTGVYLDGVQTFVQTFSSNDTTFDASELTAVWEVDDGIRSGTLRQTSDGFMTAVDVTDWDWNRHGNYRILFSLYEADTKLAQSEVVVRTGTALDNFRSTTTVEGEMTEGTETPHTNEEMTVGSSEVSGASNGAEDASSHLGYPSSDIRDEDTPISDIRDSESVAYPNTEEAFIEWSPAPIDQNQRFRYHLGEIDQAEVHAFWKSQDGHQNLVYPQDEGALEAVINMYGWRWKGQGPYEVIFTIADAETSEPLKQEVLVMSWEGEPGNSEINIRSEGVGLADADTVVADTVTQPTTPAPTVLVSQPAIVTHPPQPSTVKLLSVDKPAVRSSFKEHHSAEYQEAIEYILSQPNAVWLNGDGYDSNERIRTILDQGKTENALATFVLYNIPHRDCGSYSSGGAASGADYRAWIDRIAGVLADEQGLIIIEPDAIAQLNCAPAEARAERLQLIWYAVNALTQTSPHLLVYIDAGHPYWVSSSEMANRLAMAGVARARGFALNVSNYVATSDNMTYGDHLSALLGGKRYVIDTSRNGNGPASDFEWCNPDGRALGESPQLLSGERALDAYLWIKFPGESDGYCNNGPRAGAWWSEYAVDLYHNRDH